MSEKKSNQSGIKLNPKAKRPLIVIGSLIGLWIFLAVAIQLYVKWAMKRDLADRVPITVEGVIVEGTNLSLSRKMAGTADFFKTNDGTYYNLIGAYDDKIEIEQVKKLRGSGKCLGSFSCYLGKKLILRGYTNGKYNKIEVKFNETDRSPTAPTRTLNVEVLIVTELPEIVSSEIDTDK